MNWTYFLSLLVIIILQTQTLSRFTWTSNGRICNSQRLHVLIRWFSGCHGLIRTCGGRIPQPESHHSFWICSERPNGQHSWICHSISRIWQYSGATCRRWVVLLLLICQWPSARPFLKVSHRLIQKISACLTEITGLCFKADQSLMPYFLCLCHLPEHDNIFVSYCFKKFRMSLPAHISMQVQVLRI